MSHSVLVADDDRQIAALLVELLEGEGYEASIAVDGRDALEKFHAAPPDLLITDVMMPHMDGLTLSRRLREEGSSTPIVLMSALFADVDIPGVRFLPKPFDLDDVLQTVERLIASP